MRKTWFSVFALAAMMIFSATASAEGMAYREYPISATVVVTADTNTNVSESIVNIVVSTLVSVVAEKHSAKKRSKPVQIHRKRTETDVEIQISSESHSPSPVQHSTDISDLHPQFSLVVPKVQSLELFSCDVEKWFEVTLKQKITLRGATAYYLSVTFEWFVYSVIDVKKVRLYDGGVEKRRLTQGKQYPGIIADDTYLYVFGGECSRTCEKFTIETMLGTPIANMLEEHSHFQPCFHGTAIYVCGGKATTCEEYRPESDSFHDLSLLVPYSTSTYATIFDEYLHIIANSQRSDMLTYYWKSRVDNGDEIQVKSKIADETWGTDVRVVGENAYFLVSEMVFRLNLNNTEEESVLIPSPYSSS